MPVRKSSPKKVAPYGVDVTQRRAQQLLYLGLPISMRKVSERLNMSYSGLKKAKQSLVKNGYLTPDRAYTTKGKVALERAIVGYDDVPLSGNKKAAAVIAQIVRQKTVRLYCEIKFSIEKDGDPNLSAESAGSFQVFRTWEIKNVKFKETTVDNVRVRRTTKSVIFIPPEIYDTEIMSAKNRALEYCYQVMPKVEAWFKLRLGKPNKINITFSKQHISHVNNEIAKWFIKHRQRLVIEDLKDGRARVIVDNSKGLAELEAIHPLHAEDDAEKLKAVIEDYTLRGIETPAALKSSLLAQLTAAQERIKALEGRKINIPTMPNWLKG